MGIEALMHMFCLHIGPVSSMSTLTDLIRIIPPDIDETPEDIFASAPGLIFTDDLRTLHGDPGSTIVYMSKRFGDIELKTADPEGDEERRLFSHYLWNAGIKLAELISDDEAEDGKWRVKGERVLELGAGGPTWNRSGQELG